MSFLLITGEKHFVIIVFKIFFMFHFKHTSFAGFTAYVRVCVCERDKFEIFSFIYVSHAFRTKL